MLGLLLITAVPALVSGLRRSTDKIAANLRSIRHDKKASADNESDSVAAAVVALTPEQWNRVLQDPVILQGAQVGGKYFDIKPKSGSVQ